MSRPLLFASLWTLSSCLFMPPSPYVSITPRVDMSSPSNRLPVDQSITCSILLDLIHLHLHDSASHATACTLEVNKDYLRCDLEIARLTGTV